MSCVGENKRERAITLGHGDPLDAILHKTAVQNGMR